MIWKPDGFTRAGLLAVLVLVGVFVAGALAGAAAGRLLQAREPTPTFVPGRMVGRPPIGRGEPRPGQLRRSPALMLQRRLDLTDEQAARVEEVFEARRERIEAILREVEPRMQAQRDSTDIELRSILTDEQREAFDEMIREQRVVRVFRGIPAGRPAAP